MEAATDDTATTSTTTTKSRLGKMPDLTERELDELLANNIHWSVKRAAGELHRHRAARPSPEELAYLEGVFVVGSKWGAVVRKLLAAHGLSIGSVDDVRDTGSAARTLPSVHRWMRGARLSWIAESCAQGNRDVVSGGWILSFGPSHDGRPQTSIPVFAGPAACSYRATVEDRETALLATDLAKHEGTRQLSGRVDVVRAGAITDWILLDRGQVTGWGAFQVSR